MAPYIYKKLGDSGEPVIRILILSPGMEAAPLHGRLEECRLDEASPYEALSYRWGPPNQDAVMNCSGGRIEITETLALALRVLRFHDKARRLWIDQICIDQQNTKERSQQVQLMRRIYSCGERTVVWLGDDEEKQGPTVQNLFSAFRNMGVVCRNRGYCTTTSPYSMSIMDLYRFKEEEKARNNEDERMVVNHETTWFPSDDILQRSGLPTRSSKAWPAFNALLQSLYFTRVWTLQEVLNSRATVILWGTTELSWAALRGAYRWAVLNHCIIKDPRPTLQSPGLEEVEFLEAELLWFRGMRHRTLGELVTACCQGFQATQPKDQIYALVSLASDGGRLSFNIDYDKSDAEVFADLAKYLLWSGDSTVLNLAGLHRDQSPPGLPSWVPSWCSRLDFWRTDAHNVFTRMDVAEPVIPIVGGVQGSYQAWGGGDKDFAASNGSKLNLQETNTKDQLLVKGFQLDQAEIICTRQNYDDQSPCMSIAAQYNELFAMRASPTTSLQAMICCMVSATRASDPAKNDKIRSDEASCFDCDELLAQLISSTFESMLSSKDPSGPEFSNGLELISLASEALDSRVTSTESSFSKLSVPSQDYIKSAIRQSNPGRLTQGVVEKVIEGISAYWTGERTTQFRTQWGSTGAGRKLFLTTRGHVGIGPARMSTADVIIIAYGGRTPYVLRPIPDTPEYTLLGECYIYGFMYGEAMHTEGPPAAEWFCLGTEPDMTVEALAASSGTKEK